MTGNNSMKNHYLKKKHWRKKKTEVKLDFLTIVIRNGEIVWKYGPYG